MIRHHHEQKMTDITVIDDVLCNKCGKSIYTGMTADDGKPHINGITLRMRWGYESKKDQVETVSHICEDCHDAFAASFKIPQVVIDCDHEVVLD
jgi:hypothetical protein